MPQSEQVCLALGLFACDVRFVRLVECFVHVESYEKYLNNTFIFRVSWPTNQLGELNCLKENDVIISNKMPEK